MSRATTSDCRERAGDYHQFADSLRSALAPADPLEEVVAERAIASAWRLDRAMIASKDAEAERAERSLFRSIRILAHLRRQPARGVNAMEARDADRSETTAQWRDRLLFDPWVSEDSPVVRGTWITAAQVVSLIVEGWSWRDVLRAHPELTEDDVRSCLSYAVESA